jgi:hypothetical protein
MKRIARRKPWIDHQILRENHILVLRWRELGLQLGERLPGTRSWLRSRRSTAGVSARYVPSGPLTPPSLIQARTMRCVSSSTTRALITGGRCPLRLRRAVAGGPTRGRRQLARQPGGNKPKRKFLSRWDRLTRCGSRAPTPCREDHPLCDPSPSPSPSGSPCRPCPPPRRNAPQRSSAGRPPISRQAPHRGTRQAPNRLRIDAGGFPVRMLRAVLMTTPARAASWLAPQPFRSANSSTRHLSAIEEHPTLVREDVLGVASGI